MFVDGLFDYESLKVIRLTIAVAIDMPNVAFRTTAWKLSSTGSMEGWKRKPPLTDSMPMGVNWVGRAAYRSQPVNYSFSVDRR